MLVAARVSDKAHGDASQPEASGPGLPAQVRETEEVERLRFPDASCRPLPGGAPPKLEQPSLVGMQLQPELREPFAKVGEEPLCIFLMLEPRDEVVGETHDDHIPVRKATPPPGSSLF